MSNLVYNTIIKAWRKPNGSVDVRTDPVVGVAMLHNLTKEEWGVIELFLDALTNLPSPVPYILHEIKWYVDNE